MTITLNLPEDIAQELTRQAALRGMDVPAYAATLLEAVAQPAERPPHKQTLSEFLMASPLAGSGINLERDKDPGRTIEL